MQSKKIRLLTLENWGKTGRHESRLPIPQHQWVHMQTLSETLKHFGNP